jgi:hypothetical protein
MREMGAWRALNLDGGGSTTMYIANRGGVVNHPSDGCCRVVSNHLGIEIVEPFGTLHGFVRALDVSDAAAGLAGAEVALSTGAMTVADEMGRFRFDDVPASEVTITARFPGFDPGERVRYVAAGDDTWGSIALQPIGGTGVEPGDETGSPTDPEGDPAGAPRMEGGCRLAAGRPGGLAAALLLLTLATASRSRRRRGRGRGRP